LNLKMPGIKASHGVVEALPYLDERL